MNGTQGDGAGVAMFRALKPHGYRRASRCDEDVRRPKHLLETECPHPNPLPAGEGTVGRRSQARWSHPTTGDKGADSVGGLRLVTNGEGGRLARVGWKVLLTLKKGMVLSWLVAEVLVRGWVTNRWRVA